LQQQISNATLSQEGIKMVTLNRIYTRTGDDGTTGLVGGERTKKTSLRVCAYGDIDELNCHIGICVTLLADGSIPELREMLITIQNELFDIGSELATPPGQSWPGLPQTTAEHVERLERWIDQLNAELPELKSFVLPGGTHLNAQAHLARAVCRRAERAVLTLAETEPVSPEVGRYLNRLSDLLFVMSRSAAHAAGTPEYLWVPGGQRPIVAMSLTKAPSAVDK
jgi:cob(I)alamin adenosyltransferase